MADKRIEASHDINDNSFTIVYEFEGQAKRVVNILKGEAANLDEATVLADQRAANLKKQWQDDKALLDAIIGEVVLPQPKEIKEAAEAEVLTP